MQSLRKYLSIFCGYFYLWLVIINVTGHIILSNKINFGTCTPYIGMFGAYEIPFECSIREFLLITISIPQLLTAPIYLFLALLSIGKPDFIIWLLFSAPFLLIAVPGFLYWKEKSFYFSLIITSILAAYFIYLGLILKLK